MPSPETNIMVALYRRVTSLDPALPVSWSNVSFDPPADGKYLVVTFIPNGTERRFLGSDEPHRLQGLLQVSVFWPQNAGDYPIMEQAAVVVAHFPTDLRLIEGDVSVRVTKRPEIGPLMIDGNRAMVPVTMAWESWT